MKLSVVIPFYNLDRYVRPCLDSVAAAARGADTGLEVVCVDDGSTDGTPAALDGAGAKDPRIRVVHKPNGGEGSARNAGVAATTGDWVTFLDGDDVWLPNHLEVAVPILRHHPEADIVALRYADFDDGAPPPAPTGAEETVFDLEESVPSEVVLEVGVFPTFFRRGFAVQGKFSSLPLGADRLYMAQCFARARIVVKCDAVVHGYRVRAGSMARAVWNARKVVSQCDYAFGSLAELAASGKAVGREGLSYLASLWLSDVPNRLLRLPRGECRSAWRHWRGTLDSECVRTLPRFDRIRRILRLCSASMMFSLAVARAFRKFGVS